MDAGVLPDIMASITILHIYIYMEVVKDDLSGPGLYHAGASP